MINYNEDESINTKSIFIKEFGDLLNAIKTNKNINDIVILCVGTDRITGDCYGPLVGSNLEELLKNDNISNVNIYGTLENSINYNNIQDVLKNLNDNTCVIVVDAALSKKENIGKIFISSGKTALGKGLKKSRIEIGDISIKSVIGKDCKIPNYNFKMLQNIPLNNVMKLAKITSEGIYHVIKNN